MSDSAGAGTGMDATCFSIIISITMICPQTNKDCIHGSCTSNFPDCKKDLVSHWRTHQPTHACCTGLLPGTARHVGATGPGLQFSLTSLNAVCAVGRFQNIVHIIRTLYNHRTNIIQTYKQLHIIIMILYI